MLYCSPFDVPNNCLVHRKERRHLAAFSGRLFMPLFGASSSPSTVLWGPLFRTSCFALHDGLSFSGRSLSRPCSGWCLRQASLSSSPRRSVSTRRSFSSSRVTLSRSLSRSRAALSRSLSRRSLISLILPPLSLRGLGRDL